MPVSAAAATLRFEMDEAGALAQANHWAAQPLPLSATSWYRGSLHLRLAGAAAAVASVRRRLAGAELEPQAAGHWWQDLRDQRHEFFALGRGCRAR